MVNDGSICYGRLVAMRRKRETNAQKRGTHFNFSDLNFMGFQPLFASFTSKTPISIKCLKMAIMELLQTHLAV